MTSLDIAVIGMAARFPGARDVREFWTKLCAGIDCVSAFTDDEMLRAGASPEALRDPLRVRKGAALEDIDLFDAAFFGVSSREAEAMDPQHRIFLEVASEAIESAGYDPERYEGLIGVYAGAGPNTYIMAAERAEAIRETFGEEGSLLLNGNGPMVARVSYKLNLRGPSVFIHTACSTSLVATHLACQELLGFRCDMALAGGVGIKVDIARGYVPLEGMLSPDGRCRAFDAAANGMLPGNGAGAVLLKRLDDALTDGDVIHGVIKGSAINNDGSAKVGFTAPSVQGQAEVIVAAHAIAGVEPETIGYIEAHGTATPLGDTIEIAALSRAFSAMTTKRRFCGIGSLKTNMGHLDTAAGVAGLIKTVLALENGRIPPSLHFERQNPSIDFDGSPVFVISKLEDWPSGRSPRRACVSSFGMGGTNAHVVLEEAPARTATASGWPWHLVLLSARTESALEATTRNLVAHLGAAAKDPLPDLAYTLQVGRRQLECRRFVVAEGAADAVEALSALPPARSGTRCDPARAADASTRSVVFLFPGHGSLYTGATRGLYHTAPAFKRALDECAAILRTLLDLDLRELLYAREASESAASDPLTELPHHPALFSVEYALAQQWISCGIEPASMLGHSVGEYVAACLAGVLSLPDALRLVAFRARFIESSPPGAMLAVSLPEERVRSLLPPDLYVAAINSPRDCVLSGPSASIEAMARRLAGDQVDCQPIHIDRAAHSDLMRTAADSFLIELKRIRMNPPRRPYVSSVTGAPITRSEATDPAYWARHLHQTVRFSEGVRGLLQDPSRVFLEVGPGQTLASFTRKHLERPGDRLVVSSTRHARAHEPDSAVLLTALGRLWLEGIPIRWEPLYAGEKRRRVTLPTYPFQRRSHWIERTGAPRGQDAQAGAWLAPSWTRRPLPRADGPGDSGADLAAEAPWLVLEDDATLCRAFVARLRDEGRSAILIRHATLERHAALERLGDGRYALDPRRPEGFGLLVDQLQALPRRPTRVVHFWTLGRDGAPPGPEEAEVLGFRSVEGLAGELGRRELGASIWIVSTGAHAVTGDEDLNPDQAAVTALCRPTPGSIVRITGVDLAPLPSATADASPAVDRLLSEIAAMRRDPLVAYRGRHRWVLQQSPVSPADAPAPARAPRATRATPATRTCLITGGLGDVGFPFAQQLASAPGARLLLVEPPAAPEPTGVNEPPEWVELERLEATLAAEIPRRPEGFDEAANRLCISYICEYLQRCGLPIQQGAQHRLGELESRLPVDPRFRRFFRYMIQCLAEDGVIDAAGEMITFRRTAAALDPARPQLERCAALFPDFAGLLQELDRIANHYAKVLGGEVEAVSVLYPDGRTDSGVTSFETALKHSNVERHMAVAIEHIHALAAQASRKGRRLRILEIGSGTGQLTWKLARRLEGTGAEYTYTDVGRSFVNAAKLTAQQAGLHAMGFRVLDVARDAVGQGFPAASFDVIAAYNVLHVAPSIEAAVSSLARLLDSRGQFVILEASRVSRWQTLLHGMKVGWWQFADEHRRDSPLIPFDRWEHIFGAQDYAHRVLPDGADRRRDADHALIVAQPRAAPQGARSAERTARLDALRALASVHLLAAEPADEIAMGQALRQVEPRWGPIHAVVHAPDPVARPDGGSAAKRDPGGEALRVLSALLDPRPLELAWAISRRSAAEITGDDARGAYFAAHAGESQLRGGVRWQAVTCVTRDALAPVVLPPGAVERLQSLEGLPHVVVQAGDPATPAVPPRPDRPTNPLGAPHAGRPAASAGTRPRTEVERTIAGLWEQLLGESDVGVEDSFLLLGGESLLATQLISRLRALFQVELSVADFLKTPTVAFLAKSIARARSEPQVNAPALTRRARDAYRERPPGGKGGSS